MNIEDIKTLIRLGFEPAHYFKRSAWVKVERVMEFLVNKGEVTKASGQVKYSVQGGCYNNADVTRWAEMFMKSPLGEHLDGMQRLSRDLGLPLNSGKLLTAYMNLNTK